jgi:threonine dehydratase
MNLDLAINNFEAARATVEGLVQRTPLLASRWLGERTGLRMWLKAESLQVTGSFKVRGALNKLRHLSAAERERGVITASTGNHGLAVAYASMQAGIPCCIVLPETTKTNKMAVVKACGADLVLHGQHYGAADARARALAETEALVYIDSVIDPYIIAGYGTTAFEIVEDLPDVEAVLIPIGGGGCISGMATVLRHFNPKVRIIGVEAEGCGLYSRSRRQGQPVKLKEINTIADGLTVDVADPTLFGIIERLVDDIVLVSDEDVLLAVRFLLEQARLVAEPAGAATTAALLAGKASLPKGTRTAVLISGGNLDFESQPVLSRSQAQ